MDKPELADLPAASGLPTLDELEERKIEFVHQGKRHVVVVGPQTWGRARALQQGLKVETYEKKLDGEMREITIADPAQQAAQVQKLFGVYVKSINGTAWDPKRSVDELDGDWVQTFLRVFMPTVSTPMEDARKKSNAP